MLIERLRDLERAVGRLREILDKEKNEIVRDSAIKRFELCFDLAWKTVKDFAKREGIECFSPRECFKTAFKVQLIDYDEKWLEMIETRNLSVHIYKEEIADKVYEKLPDYFNLFRSLIDNIKKALD